MNKTIYIIITKKCHQWTRRTFLQQFDKNFHFFHGGEGVGFCM